MTRTLEQGTLTIDGGSLPENFSEHKSIERLVVKEGVSSVGNFAFGFCENNFCVNLQKIFCVENCGFEKILRKKI